MTMRATGLLSVTQLQLLLAVVKIHQYLSLAMEFSNSRGKPQAVTALKERGRLRVKYQSYIAKLFSVIHKFILKINKPPPSMLAAKN